MVMSQLELKMKKTFEVLAKLPFTQANQAQLLINGRQTFKDIFEGIENAKDYVLVQPYIINDDQLGNELLEILAKAVQKEIRVFF